MRGILRTISAAAAALVSTVSLAQNVSDLIVSEVLVDNVSSIVDAYGRRSGWIELFNTSQGTVNYAGCFLSDGTVTYMIPKGDLSTRLGPRQSVIFYCGGESGDGTFYTNFTLRPGTTVSLISNDGKTVIDSLSIPSDLPSDMSARKVALDAKALRWEADPNPAIPSPGAMNLHTEIKTGAERVSENDPHGWVLTLTSISVVFGALLILWFLFSLTGRFIGGVRRKKAPEMALPADDGDDVAAAIALALDDYLGTSAHDAESYVITINRTDRTAWSTPGRNFRNKPSR